MLWSLRSGPPVHRQRRLMGHDELRDEHSLDGISCLDVEHSKKDGGADLAEITRRLIGSVT